MLEVAVTAPLRVALRGAEATPTSLASGSYVVDAAALWPRLMEGEFLVVGHDSYHDGCSLLLHSKPVSLRVALPAPLRQVTERLLAGVLQKVVAYDIGCSTSTVSGTGASALRALGLNCCITRVPLALVVLAAAHHSPAAIVSAECRWSVRESTRLLSVRLPHPHRSLSAWLTEAELEVARLVMDGHSHDDVAVERGRSSRTIANQLASIFRKVNVTGRLGLVSSTFALDTVVALAS